MKTVTTSKAASLAEPKPQANPQPEMRILKIASCPSLSGKSKLTYQIGCTAKSEIHIRVWSSTSAGFVNRIWIPFAAIQQLLDKQPDHRPFTSYVLFPLFRGKSINSPFALFAALKQEGLFQPSKYKRRCYDRVPEKAFLTLIKTLISSAVNLKADDKPPRAKSNVASATKNRSKSKS